jgi:hypothetical protein
MTHQIIDNFLDEEVFEKIQYTMTKSLIFPWYIQNFIVHENETIDESLFLGHIIYSNNIPRSSYFEMITPIVEKINPVTLVRVKCNLYPNIGKYIEHEPHIDAISPQKGAIFYINTNNGYTILEDGTKIESVANRMAFFDTSKLHKSTTCTNVKYRININFNYI